MRIQIMTALVLSSHFLVRALQISEPSKHSFRRYCCASSYEELPAVLQSTIQSYSGIAPYEQPSAATGTIVVDYRLLPALFPFDCINQVKEVVKTVRKNRATDYYSFTNAAGISERAPIDVAIVRAGLYEPVRSAACNDMKKKAFDVVQETAGIRTNPQCFIAFGYRTKIDVHIHQLYEEPLKALTFKQRDFMIALFGTQAPLSQAARAALKRSEKVPITLSQDQIALFYSLPPDIRDNLQQNYHLHTKTRDIVAAHRREMLPALSPDLASLQLSVVYQGLRQIMQQEGLLGGARGMTPVAFMVVTYDVAQDCFIQEPLYYQKGKQLVAAVKNSKNRVTFCKFDFPRTLEKDLRKYCDLLEDSTAHFYVLVGLSNGRLDVYAPEHRMRAAEQLSVEQLHFILNLASHASHDNSPLFLDKRQVQLFLTLPEDMQKNLQKNYPLAVTFSDYCARKAPQLFAGLSHVAALYKKYSRKRLFTGIKLVGQTVLLAAGLCYYAQRKPALATRSLRPLFLGSAATVLLGHRYGSRIQQYLAARVPCKRLREKVHQATACRLMRS